MTEIIILTARQQIGQMGKLLSRGMGGGGGGGGGGEGGACNTYT